MKKLIVMMVRMKKTAKISYAQEKGLISAPVVLASPQKSQDATVLRTALRGLTRINASTTPAPKIAHLNARMGFAYILVGSAMEVTTVVIIRTSSIAKISYAQKKGRISAPVVLATP